MAAPPDTELQEIASQIEAYLDTHPHAADTVEGITTWWVTRQRLSEALERVQQALELMVETGRITARRGPGGSLLYSRAPQRPPGERPA